MSSNIREIRDEIRMLEAELDDARRGVTRYISTLSEGIGLARRMGLPENMNEQAMQLQRIIAIVYALVAAYRALQAARLAGGDPLAWIHLGVEASTAGFGIGNLLYDATRGT